MPVEKNTDRVPRTTPKATSLDGRIQDPKKVGADQHQSELVEPDGSQISRHLPGSDPNTIGTQRDGHLVPGAAGLRMQTSSIKLKSVSLRELYQSDPKKADRILSKYYNTYLKAFPDPDEVEPKSVMKAYLKNTDDNWNVTVLMDGSKVLGGFHTRVLNTAEGPYGVIEHLWIEEGSRRAGLGSQATASAIALMKSERTDLCGILGEVNDPRLMSAEQITEDSLDPWNRFKFWTKLGAKAIDAPYEQAPLEEGGESVPYLCMFLIPNGDETTIPKKAYLSAIEDYFASFSTFEGKDPKEHEVFQRIAEGTKGDTLQLLPLSTPRSFIGADA